MQMSPAIDQLADALSKAQAVMEGAAKDAKNPHLKNKYADLGSVWEACREPLAKNGLAVVQVGGRDATGQPALHTLLLHKSGQWISGELPLDISEHKGINAMQALGSAVTYARRYGLSGAVGVVAEDDDGQGAGAPQQRKQNGIEQVMQDWDHRLSDCDTPEHFDEAARQWFKSNLMDPVRGEVWDLIIKRAYAKGFTRDSGRKAFVGREEPAPA